MLNDECGCGFIARASTALELDKLKTSWKCPDCKEWNKRFTPRLSELDKAFEVIERKQISIAPHPLLNPDSPHYKMVDDVEAIERMEQMYSTEELMHWAKVTAMKYRLRIGSKDAIAKEAKKIETYEAYYKYLEAKLSGE